MNRHKKYALPLILLVVFYLAIPGCPWSRNLPNLVRTVQATLPTTTSGFKSQYVDIDPDYMFYAKGTLTPQQFQELCEKLRLTIVVESSLTTEESALLSWRNRDLAPDWWNPTPDRSNSYYRFDGREWICCKLEGDVLFLTVNSH